MKTTTIFGFYSPPSSSKLSFLSSLVSSVSTRKCLPGLTQLEYSFVISYSGETRIEGYQGGRSWQPFSEGKNGHKNIRQTQIFYFGDKRVVFARNCKLNSVKHALNTIGARMRSVKTNYIRAEGGDLMIGVIH